MNLKKFLIEWAEKDAEKLLTEEDKLFIEQLVEREDIWTKRRKFKRRKNKKKDDGKS